MRAKERKCKFEGVEVKMARSCNELCKGARGSTGVSQKADFRDLKTHAACFPICGSTGFKSSGHTCRTSCHVCNAGMVCNLCDVESRLGAARPFPVCIQIVPRAFQSRQTSRLHHHASFRIHSNTHALTLFRLATASSLPDLAPRHGIPRRNRVHARHRPSRLLAPQW